MARTEIYVDGQWEWWGGFANIVPSPNTQSYDLFGQPHRTTPPGAPWGRHEVVPLRLDPQLDWYEGATFGVGPDWSQSFVEPRGHIVIGTGNTVANVRLQTRNAHCVYLDTNDNWVNVVDFDPNEIVQGKYVDATFADTGITSDVRSEAGNGGGWSVSLAPLVGDTDVTLWQWSYQSFFPRPVAPAGAKALFTAVQARLITDDTQLAPDDPSAPECVFEAAFGCDAASSASIGVAESRFYQPRLKRIRHEWIWLSGHSFVEFWTSGFNATHIAAAPVTAWDV